MTTFLLPKDEVALHTIEVLNTPRSEEEKQLSQGPLSKARFWLIFATLSLVLCINGIDANVLGDIAPRISVVLHTEHVSWLASISLVMAAALNLPIGALYKVLEPKFLLLGSLVVLAIGAAIAGSAKSFNVLVIGRVLVGISLGSTPVASFLLVGVICKDTRERAIFLSLVTALYGVMIKAGPLIAGAFLKHSQDDWRWCFYIELPIVFITATMMLIGFPRFKTVMQATNVAGATKTIGWRTAVSSLLQGVFVLSLLVPCLLGGSTISWKSPFLIICYTTVLPSLVAFLVWEHRIADHERLLPLVALKTDRRLCCISIITFCAILVTFAATYFIPIYFQIVKSSSPLRAAVQLLPFAASGTFSCVLVGKIVELTGSYYHCCIVGSLVQILGAGLFLSVTDKTPLAIVYVYGAFTGFGFGSLTAIGNTIALHDVEPQNFARSVAWINFILSLSASIGIGIQGAIFSDQLKQATVEIGKIFTNVDLSKMSLSDFLTYLHAASSGDPIVEIGRAHTVKAQQYGTAMYLACGIISLAASVALPNRKL